MTVALDAALSGLKAAQRALDTVSNNISNAGTEGYTRKILPQEALIVGGIGAGVKLQAIVRNVDKTLLKDLMRQVSVKEYHTTNETYLARIQDFHGASDAERSISARIGQLADAFSELSNSPDSAIQLQETVTAARQVASTFNEFSKMLSNMRIQTESEIGGAVAQVNQSLRAIADLNIRISVLTSKGQSSAELEDQRDLQIKNVSKYMEVSTFATGDNKIVVMTRQGHNLADDTAHELSFDKSNVLPSSYYPGGGLSGVYLDGSTEITSIGIGGQIGSLLNLRDNTVPTYQAQVDEMAQKLAYRFDTQGLRLFTDTTGNVPANVAPPAAVGYVGFASRIRVNTNIVDDPTLLRSGTYGQTVLPGSNEMTRKITEFAFGPYEYQEARGTANISAGTIFAATGLTQIGQMIGTVDLTDYDPDLDSAPNITAPANFTLTISGVPQLITVNPGDTATDLVNTINAAFGSTVADLNGLGQLRINASGSIAVANGTIGIAGLADLGLSVGTTAAQNPSFSVQVGTQSPVTITIPPAATSATILAALNAIDGLSASLGPGGELLIEPSRGGDITIKNVVGDPLQALGMTLNNIAHTAFRQDNLGPGANLSTGLLANSTIEDFARGVVTAQSEDHNMAVDTLEKESTFFETLDKRNSDQSGVDIDEELSTLVRLQAAYSAAARMISASEKMLDELFQVF